MGFDFDGHVLRAPRNAPGNAATTSEPGNAVVRDVRVPPARTAAQPTIVDLAGDQYRAAVLQAPGTTPDEFLVWAANSGQVARADDPSWWESDGTGRVPVGEFTLPNPLDPGQPFTDGTDKVVVSDNGGRDISDILYVVLARGGVAYDDDGWVDASNPSLGRAGTAPYPVIVPRAVDQSSGLVHLTPNNVFTTSGGLVQADASALLDDGLSVERGDRIVEVWYRVSPQTFWWSRNDRYETRFGWNDKLQRWAPYKGSAPVNLGVLSFEGNYTLTPKLRSLPVGAVLAGDATNLDQYAVVRVGDSPGVLGYPVASNDPDGFTGVEVVSDSSVEERYDFTASTAAAVVGQTSGVMQFNPNFITKHAGKTVWYSYGSFDKDANGIVGGISDDLYLAPIPAPTDHPFIRINNRSPLRVSKVPTEADLPADLPEGFCAVALSTGRLVLSDTDVRKADPLQTLDFDKHFLGAQVIYDGVALNATPQPTKRPVALVQADGVTETLHPTDPMYLRPAELWPEVAGDGIGRSGVLFLPDGTGAVPNPEGVDPSLVPIPVRPGGDTLPAPGGGAPPQSIGLVRRIHDGVSDTILFSRQGAVTETEVVDRVSDLPSLPFEVQGGKAHISREGVSIGGVFMSQVQISAADRTRFAGETVYFLQAAMQPSTYTEQARIYSKSRIVFRFDAADTLYFAIDGTAEVWSASSLPAQNFYTAEEVAASIQAAITGTGVCRAEADRVVLESSDPAAGIVEIGWGDPKDLSGAAALGFMPGWRAQGGVPNWLSDSGVSLGMARSLLNLDRSSPDADYRHRIRLEDETLVGSVQPSPFVFFDFPPVEDIPGYDEGVFFNLQTVALQGDDLQIIDKRLEHYKDVQHRFFEGNFAWLEEGRSSNTVKTPVTTLNLGKPAVVPESMLGAPGIEGGILTAEEGGRYAFQEQDVDYLVPNEGQPGNIQLVTRLGARYATGSGGLFTAGGTTFEDANANFLADSNDRDIDPATGFQKIDGSGNLVWLPVVRPGFRLKVTSGDAQGSYIVTSVTDATHIEVSPPFPASVSRVTPWEVYGGVEDSLYDPSVVADVVYERFDHLPEEPFKIRVLSPVGVITDAAATSFIANVEDANTKGRAVSLRFGPVHASSGAVASLSPLEAVDLGALANNSLVLPDDQHVTDQAFRLVVGTETFTFADGIVAVASFSANPAAVEYLTAAWDDGTKVHPRGELKFNSTLLSDLETSMVLYVEELLPAGSLASGEVQYDTKTGALRISAADAAAYTGSQVYFTEQMITTEGGNADVAISPLVGAVGFRKPVGKGCLVEMEYFTATNEGRRIGAPGDEQVEFLPVFIRREEATRLQNNEFQIDPNGEHVIDDRVEPIVYLGPNQQNFGTDDFTISTRGGVNGRVLTFNRDLPAWVTPVATYAVFDAQGGERAYETSLKPVYRPPFFIKAGVSSFGLRGDRSADFQPGQMMRVGGECFYITALTYLSDRDVTKMEIHPPTTVEVGSRSPGNDILTLVTSEPVTPTLFPDSAAPVATGAKLGFMQEIPVEDFPFEPVYANQNSITFLGDLSAFAVPGHLMEVGGLPFTIASVTLSSDGTRTKVTFTSPFRSAIDPSGNPTVRLSYRPVYPPNTRTFLGVGPLVSTEPLELTLFGEEDGEGNELPGRELARTTEWDIDPQSGIISLLDPLQQPLGPRQRLVLSFTRLREMRPFYRDGRVVFPRWQASFRHNVVPTKDNGFLGGRVTATYTFDHPDTFYYRAVSLRSFLGEAVTEALDELKRGQSSSGPRLSVSPSDDNWTKGNIGIPAERRALLDKDRAARILVSFYNDTVNFFEQIEETITGKYIGDRDGKFRFWVGRGLEFAPPGYEDEISGELNPNNVFVTVFNAFDPSREITFVPDADPLVRPSFCTMSDLVLSGEPMPSSQIRKVFEQQKALIRNDVDDIILLGASRPRVVATNAPPYFTLEQMGRFARMGEAHRFSRIYPTSAGVFFTLVPGIGSDASSGDPGAYAWRRVNGETGESESTYRQQIGQVGNPVLGDIQNISQTLLQDRLPRARVFGYYPDGLPASAFGAAVSEPCLVVSLVPLSDLPVDPSTGFPAVTRLLSQDPSGDIPDALAGNPDLSLPGFESGQKLAWGEPSGNQYAGVYPEEVDVFGAPVYTGLFVHDVLFGCVIRFADRTGGLIGEPGKVMVATGPAEGVPAHVFGIGRSDTVYVVPPDAENPISDPDTESPSMADLQSAAAFQPGYRVGFDLAVQGDGRVLDVSMPSWSDPFLFPIKEILGQNPPSPLSHLEGEVEFASTDVVPLNIPALAGQPLDDAGDQRIPYLKGSNTELDRFDEIGNVLGDIMARDAVLGGYYPDEILFTDGEVVGTATATQEPAALYTNTPPASADYGESPARAGDFVLAEVDVGAPQDWQGSLSVGRLSADGSGNMVIEPPRFVTQANKGSRLRYLLENYAVYTTPGNYPVDPQVANPPGLRLFGDVANSRLVLSFQDAVLALNDGAVVSAGNLNDIFAADANNVVRVKVLSRPDDTAVNDPSGAGAFVDPEKDGRVLLTIDITASDVTFTPFKGAPFGPYAHGGVVAGDFDPIGGEPVPGTVADNRHIIIAGLPAGGLDFYDPVVGVETDWYLPHDRFDPAGPTDRRIGKYGFEFAMDIDTRTGGSVTASVEEDRLTFTEVVDFRSSRPRGFGNVGNPNGTNTYETGLQVTEVTLGFGVPSSVNDVVGGLLTFESRVAGVSDSIQGTWAPGGGGAEVGSVRVMAFEYGNTPIIASGITAAVQASQSVDDTGNYIYQWAGSAEGQRILPLPGAPAANGAITQVQKGDVVYIDVSTDPLNTATEKAGTFIVRHAVEPSAGPDLYLPVDLSSFLGTGGGFITTVFPRVISIDWGAQELVVDDASMLPAAGKLFVVLDKAGLDSADPAVWQRSVFSVDWTAIAAGPSSSTLSLGAANTVRWADDSIVAAPATEITQSMVENKLLGWHDAPVGGAGASPTGVMELPVTVRGGLLPDDSSVVGHHAPGALATSASYGFHNLRLDREGTTLDFGTANMLDGVVSPVPGAGQVSVLPKAVHPNHTFDVTDSVAVYDEVPGVLRIHVSDPQGLALNAPSVAPVPATGVGVACALPGILARTYDGQEAFYAAGGIWLEPSTPMYPVDLSAGPNVVDAARSMGAGTVGMRSPSFAEEVNFEVRRVRRWHGKQDGLNNAFAPLRFAYEIRRGIVTAFLRNEQQVGTLSASGFSMDWNTANPLKPLVADVWNTGESSLSGTNLGPFDHPDVNINPGDILRLLDDDDAVVGEGVVLEIVGGSTIKIAAPGIPGIDQVDIVGLRFEVWLRQAPVPHEQTNEQLLGLITDRVVHETRADRSDADPVNWVGGYVPELTLGTAWADGANRLYDDSGSVNFVSLGVAEGDIVVIDPAGTLPVSPTTSERGFRPLGDRGVPTRTAVAPAPSPFDAGQVSSLDDNRGFYRVVAVNETFLEVEPNHSFAGGQGQDVVLADGQTNLSYAVLPTVSTSELEAPEGQNDLRPTRLAVGGTYRDTLDARNDKHSLRPFSYRIIRPTGMFSTEIVDTVLFVRERMLSLIEMFRGAMSGGLGGFYYDWQDAEHVEDLGDPTDPESGLGLFPNRLITTLVGEVGTSPFVNTYDCLSLLDRRFWILDRRLDSLEPDPNNQFAMQQATGGVSFDEQGGPYTAYTDTGLTGGALVRPVLPDHLDLILNVRDRLRAIRYTWLTYRTHRFVGTLARIQAFDAALPERLEERRRALLLDQTADGVTT